ncbi:MAG: hypothetical protein EA403_04385 [Spirochaetaceae bacterium]|nr:MAG: hypothetical protein EA403_04385 [Spirochaetaceae bacterium]
MSPRSDHPDFGEELDARSNTIGIAPGELEAIRAQIDGVFGEKAPGATAERLNYTPQRSASVSLIVLNAAAIALTAAALFGLWTLLQPVESVSVAAVAPPGESSAQAGLFERFREDAAVELSEREREIAGIRGELERLAAVEDGAPVDSATTARIATLEAALREAQEAERAAAQRVDSMDLLSRLQRSQQQEQLLATQLSVALGRITDLEGQLEAAEAAERPVAAPTEPVQPRESPLDRRAAQVEQELREQVELQLAEQQREAQQLRTERDRWQAEVVRLTAARDAIAAERDALAGQRAQLRSRLASAAGVLRVAPVAAEPSRNEVIDAVGSKVEVMSILSDEPIRSRHPGLDARLEQYLDALVTEARRAGRLEGLADARWLLQRARAGTISAGDFAGRFTETERRELQQLLSESEALVR